jgi:hypothetical protein
MEPLARLLILAGIVLLGLGLLLHFGSSVPYLGKLPGDIRIERPGFHLYVPVTSCLLASAIVTGVLWVVSRLR